MHIYLSVHVQTVLELVHRRSNHDLLRQQVPLVYHTLAEKELYFFILLFYLFICSHNSFTIAWHLTTREQDQQG